ncbi:UNVERIFIED_CONTAM: Polyadenylate-binding protein-interacting protein 11 [Sesamum radiatum]|uniref:Polyadenylate-binding protein-interacting protein 11 n=1 Tax=Sesamum radiatum TaxID=300843 RepID=A0AAW2KDZ2_SESRA
MAVVENAAINSVKSSNPDAQQNNVAGDHPHHQQSTKAAGNNQKSTKPTDQNFHLTQQKMSNGHHQLQQHPINGNGVPLEKKMDGDDDGGGGFKREMRFRGNALKVEPDGGGICTAVSRRPWRWRAAQVVGGVSTCCCCRLCWAFWQHLNTGVSAGNSFRRVTEEQLAALFISCGQVVDCRVCGDPNSVLRFAFIEFTDEEGARNALSLAGTMLGYYPVRVLPSKTAIAPVNPTFLPRVTQADVKLFFESICGEVHRLRLLGDYHHSTRIAFVEFVMAESAIAALNCSGAVLGSLPIRVSPSKTPVRPRAPRQSMN